MTHEPVYKHLPRLPGRLSATIAWLRAHPRAVCLVASQWRKDAILAKYGAEWEPRIVVHVAEPSEPETKVNWVEQWFRE